MLIITRGGTGTHVVVAGGGLTIIFAAGKEAVLGVREVPVVGAVPVAGVGRAEHVEDRARRGRGEPVHVPAGLREQHQRAARRAEVGVQHQPRQPRRRTTMGVRAGGGPVVGGDVQRAVEQLAEHRHPRVVVQRDDRARGQEEDHDLHAETDRYQQAPLVSEKNTRQR